jgi:predicted transcriptional regulator of viral defense system
MVRAVTARKAGVHPRTLAAMRDTGAIEQLGRGLYRLVEAPPNGSPDLVIVAKRVPSAVICLISALAFHELTTQIPHRVDIALTPGARTPKLDHPPVQVYRFSGKALTTGIEDQLLDGHHVRVYSAAKTVADCFKFRNKIGVDVAIEALRTYCRRRGAKMDDLMRFAEIDRVKRVMMPYVEATL